MKHTMTLDEENSREPMKRFCSCGLAVAGALVLATTMGCNGLPASTPVSAAGPQTYMTPIIAGTAPGGTTGVGLYTVNSGATYYLATYTVDDKVDTFSQTTTSFIGVQTGTVVKDAGTFTVSPTRGLLSLATTYTLPYSGNAGSITYNPPLPGSYALELAGQAGGLVQLLGQPATPLVATASCPSFPTAQTFQFITLPEASWSSSTQTAFGSVSVGTSGTAVNFSKIQQFTLPVNGGAAGAPTSTYDSTATGVCSSTPYGNTISVPAEVAVDPVTGAPLTNPVILGIGPSGLLVESAPDSQSVLTNVLGSGTGAVGVPQPASPLGATPVAGTTAPQYMGFLYSTGTVVSGSVWSSSIVSFGFQAVPSACSSVTPPTGTLIYGGDFPINTTTGLSDPTSANAQNPNYPYGSCDLAIDLGPESATGNGLYTAAKVWIGSKFLKNPTTAKSTYSFPAVAIAGQLNGKFVILVIGEDAATSPSQAWCMYLMQTN